MTLKEIAQNIRAYMDESLSINWQTANAAKAALTELDKMAAYADLDGSSSESNIIANDLEILLKAEKRKQKTIGLLDMDMSEQDRIVNALEAAIVILSGKQEGGRRTDDTD